MRRRSDAPGTGRLCSKADNAIYEPAVVSRSRFTAGAVQAVVDKTREPIHGSDHTKIQDNEMHSNPEVLAAEDLWNKNSQVLPEPELQLCRQHPNLDVVQTDISRIEAFPYDDLYMKIRSSKKLQCPYINSEQSPIDECSCTPLPRSEKHRMHYNLGIFINPPKVGRTRVVRQPRTPAARCPLSTIVPIPIQRRTHPTSLVGKTCKMSGIYVFQTRHMFPVCIMKFGKSWRARIMDVARQDVSVLCGPKTDLETEISMLIHAPKSFTFSRLHIVKRHGQRVLFLGSIGLSGGHPDNAEEVTSSEEQNVQFESLPEALVHAAETGNLREINRLVQNGASVNVTWNDGETPLFVAASNGHLDTVKWLFESGASIEAAANDGATPLFVAAQEGHLDTVKWLFESGASIEAAMNDGTTPLDIAAFYGHLDTVKWLVRNGASIDVTRNDGTTPLFVAAQEGHLDTVKWLFENGASIEAATNDGQTPLYIAARNGHLDTVKWLFESGASIGVATNDGWTPLHVAAIFSHFGMVKWMVGRGASIEAVEKYGRTLLMATAARGHLETIKWLVEENDADIEAKDKNGWTPIMFALRHKSFDAALWFARIGASTIDIREKVKWMRRWDFRIDLNDKQTIF